MRGRGGLEGGQVSPVSDVFALIDGCKWPSPNPNSRNKPSSFIEEIGGGRGGGRERKEGGN